ncbi:ABC transporter substrate-binding protein [Streptomyces sp. NPDC059810]|uniref:ABC transporter substrate-binding protein n=1 Tax=Streptomyces sp. NPDC059810 TaxID=3346956 RepID=UPI00364DF39F
MSVSPSEVTAAFLKEHRALVDTPGKDREERLSVLSKDLDYRGAASGVMTVKYSSRATSGQIERWNEALRRSVVGLLDDFLCGVGPASVGANAQKMDGDSRAVVMATAAGADGTAVPLLFNYLMHGGEWKYRNVDVNGINIGKLFRDQFQDAMNRNGNDLDKTVDTWDAEAAKALGTAQTEIAE